MQAAVEVTALVAEFSSTSLRMGYAGDDQPRLVVPSFVGVRNGGYVMGDLALAAHHEPVEVHQVVKGHQVLDWEALTALWSYALKRLQVSAEDHPIIIVMHTAFEEREQLARVALETLKHPAVFVARTPVMAAFGAGRYSGMVLDIGAEGCRVTPVHDGYVMVSATLEQRGFGGRFLSEQCAAVLRGIVPSAETVLGVLPCEVASKEPVELRQEPSFKVRTGLPLTASFRSYHQLALVNDFKETVCAVPDVPFSEHELGIRPPLYYEFPCGYNMNVGVERFRIGEALFSPREMLGCADLVGIAEMVIRAINAVDTEQRHALSTIILAGAGTLLPGLAERLSNALNQLPSSKVRIHSGSSGIVGSIERRYGAWMGASVLASLGSFQSMWMTGKELAEGGPTVVAKKFQ